MTYKPPHGDLNLSEFFLKKNLTDNTTADKKFLLQGITI